MCRQSTRDFRKHFSSRRIYIHNNEYGILKLLFVRSRVAVKPSYLVNCYGLNGMGMQALELFSQMPKHFIHEVTYICILNACSHSGLVDEARSIFQNIEAKTATVWTTMVYLQT